MTARMVCDGVLGTAADLAVAVVEVFAGAEEVLASEAASACAAAAARPWDGERLAITAGTAV